MKTVLVTGFEPFGGDARNPSAEVARALDRRVVSQRRVVGGVLPCVFGEAAKELQRLMKQHAPELVVCLGLAANRTEITPERIAINVADARIADNADRQPVDRPVVRGGPVAYWSTLPVKAIVARLQADQLPASVSHTAGTFVCNHVFYSLMHALRRRRKVRGGFIHLPWPVDWSEAKTPHGISFVRMVGGIETAIAISLRTRPELRTSGGVVA